MSSEVKNREGRPLKFQDVGLLQKQIDAFFLECDAKEEPYTITGLALALGTTRKSLCDYEDIPEFSNTIKTAKARVENYAEKRLFVGGAPTGPIFALKNYGWSDSQNINLGGQDGNNPIKASLTVSYIDTNNDSEGV